MRGELFFLIVLLSNFVVASGDIRVVVYSDEEFSDSFDFQRDNFNSVNGFSAIVSDDEYNAMVLDPKLDVFIDKQYYASLDTSGPYINSTQVWQLQENGINLTGQGTSICVIDTGVNYTHENLGGCYGNNNL